MIKVMIFKNYHFPKELTEQIARELNFQLYYIDVDPKNPDMSYHIAQIRWAEKEGIDVIICGYHEYIQFSSIETFIPIVSSNFSNWETLGIVQSLKKNIVEKQNPRPHKVALLTVEPLAVDLAELSEIFNLELHNIIRPWEQPGAEFFSDLKAQGFEVVTCSGHLKEDVLRAGMLPFYDENISSYTGIKDELNRILQTVNISQQISQRSRQLKQIINYSFDAIWMTDQQGIITSHNGKATALFDHSTEKAHPSSDDDYVGRSVCEVLPSSMNHVLEDALKNGTNYYSYLLLHSRTDGIFNINPIIKDKAVDCVIFHFTALPHLEQMEEQVRSESYIKGHHAKYTFQDIIGESAAIRQTVALAGRFAKYESNILLMGESGTGKEIFAQSIHNASRRRNQPFVALNCGALPPNLLESELFGYVDGAFTGASRKGKKGLFEIADQGTIFLDEISEMDVQGQVRLLRVLEEREVMRVGSDRVIPVNVRIIAACNKNLDQLVKEGKFRQDLFYRLNVLTLGIPPLRRREDDIALLADHFLDHYSEKYQKIVRLQNSARPVLAESDWPGNVRQLKNFCERLVIVADDNRLSPGFIREQLRSSRQFSFDPSGGQSEENKADGAAKRSQTEDAPFLPADTRAEKERAEILQALNQTHGSRQDTAALLGISTATLWRKMKKYGVSGRY